MIGPYRTRAEYDNELRTIEEKLALGTTNITERDALQRRKAWLTQHRDQLPDRDVLVITRVVKEEEAVVASSVDRTNPLLKDVQQRLKQIIELQGVESAEGRLAQEQLKQLNVSAPIGTMSDLPTDPLTGKQVSLSHNSGTVTLRLCDAPRRTKSKAC